MSDNRLSRDASRLAAARIAADAASRDPNAADPNQAFEALYAEPSPEDLVVIHTGRHLWAARRTGSTPVDDGAISAPLVPFEDLPVPGSDRAKLAPCTIRWQFTGRFSLKREEALARGSLVVQVQRFLQFKNVSTETILVTFPTSVGKGRFVDINVEHSSLAALAEAPLVYRGARLRRHLVGPALPKTALVVAITGFLDSHIGPDVALATALALQPFVTVHDVWLELQATNAAPVARPTNRILALVETEASPNGGRNVERIHAIPGYLMLRDAECTLEYEGRMEWCTTCRSKATKAHPFEHCPRRRCFNCGEYGHNADRCPVPPNDAAAAPPAYAEPVEPTVELDYGQA